MRLRDIVAYCASFALTVAVPALIIPFPAAAGTSGAAVPRAPVITAISPASGGAGDQTQVTIHGSGFTGVRSVLFGTAVATRFRVESGSVIVALGPREAAGTVRVFVVAAGGTSPAVRAGQFTFLPLPRSSLTWAKPFRAAGDGNGYPEAVSCANAHHCVAIDIGGDIITWDGRTWSAPSPSPARPWIVEPPTQASSLSCPTTTWCAVAGDSLWTGYGHSWTSDEPGGMGPWASVSCASAAFCLAATDDGWVSEYSGGAWSAPLDVDVDSPDAENFMVSCGARTLCVGMDDAGTAYWWNGTGWTPFGPSIGNGNGAQTVSCASAAFCMALDGNNVGWTFNGKAWTDTGRQAPVTGSLSCTAATFCMLAGDSAARYNGKTWTKFPRPVLGIRPAGSGGDPTDVACAGQTCAAIAYDMDGGAAIFRGGAWRREVTIDNGGELDSVSCPSASFCAAVGVADDAVIARNGRWQPPDYVASAPSLTSVSCVSATFCLASDLDGGTWRFNGRSWSRAPALPGAVSPGQDEGWVDATVSCVSQRFCVWAGIGLSVFNGTTWSRRAWSGNTWWAVSCASATLCVAGDNTAGNISVFNGRSWSRPRAADLNLEPIVSVSCLLRTRFCVVADASGGIATFNGTAWGYTVIGYNLTGVSCAASRFCAADIGFGEGAYTFNGTLWSQSGALAAWPGAEFDTAIACTSSASCVLVGDQGDVMLGH